MLTSCWRDGAVQVSYDGGADVMMFQHASWKTGKPCSAMLPMLAQPCGGAGRERARAKFLLYSYSEMSAIVLGPSYILYSAPCTRARFRIDIFQWETTGLSVAPIKESK